MRKDSLLYNKENSQHRTLYDKSVGIRNKSNSTRTKTEKLLWKRNVEARYHDTGQRRLNVRKHVITITKAIKRSTKSSLSLLYQFLSEGTAHKVLPRLSPSYNSIQRDKRRAADSNTCHLQHSNGTVLCACLESKNSSWNLQFRKKSRILNVTEKIILCTFNAYPGTRRFSFSLSKSNNDSGSIFCIIKKIGISWSTVLLSTSGKFYSIFPCTTLKGKFWTKMVIRKFKFTTRAPLNLSITCITAHDKVVVVSASLTNGIFTFIPLCRTQSKLWQT